jgi:hypothetical protein
MPCEADTLTMVSRPFTVQTICEGVLRWHRLCRLFIDTAGGVTRISRELYREAAGNFYSSEYGSVAKSGILKVNDTIGTRIVRARWASSLVNLHGYVSACSPPQHPTCRKIFIGT